MLREALRVLQPWYHTAEDRAPTPCRKTMDVKTAERVNLYAERTSPCDLIPINVQPSNVRDDTSGDAEIREAVRKLQNGRDK